MTPLTRPPKAIVMIEDHDGAYNAWKELGVRAKTLVHIDAHIDFGWIPELDLQAVLDVNNAFQLEELLNKKPLWNPFTKARRTMMNIGNYIYPAIKDGMVHKFYWIVPDPTWRSARGQRYLRDTIRWILKVKQYVTSELEIRADSLFCRIHDTDIFVMPLANLPGFSEGVLLDIDVDYMLTPFAWDDTDPFRTPWIFPEELAENIRSKNMGIDALTIAYSVNGGFTPLRFKHLGDELRSLFDNDNNPKERGLALLKREGMNLEKEKRYNEAIASYEAAAALDNADTSAYFNLCLLYLDIKNDPDKARYFYNKAVSLDKTYARAYNNRGIIYLNQGKPKKARLEYEKFLGLDEDNVFVLSSLGYIALAEKRYAAADDLFDKVLAQDASDKRSLFGKAAICFKAGRLKAAEDLFVKLADMSPDDPAVYWYLAKISEKSGLVQKAIEWYKKSVMAGGEGPLVHLLLCRIYLRKRLYLRASEELRLFLEFSIKGILGRW